MENKESRKRKSAPASGAERQRNYLKRLKDDPVKKTEVLRKDRERKKKKREKDREDAKKDTTLQEKIREKKRLEMKRYRQKKKEKKEQEVGTVQNDRANSGKKTQLKQKQKKYKQTYKEKNKLEDSKKKNAVIRTQKWRMKVKLKDISSSNTDSVDTDTDTNQQTEGFKNRMAEHRALMKAKQNLPQTPAKRAEVIRKIAFSPTCSKHLQDTFASPEMKEKAMLGERFVKTMGELVKDTLNVNQKDDRTEARNAKKGLQDVLEKTLEDTSVKRKIERKVGLRAKNKKKNHDTPWWKTKSRKIRKDCIMAQQRREVTLQNFLSLVK